MPSTANTDSAKDSTASAIGDVERVRLSAAAGCLDRPYDLAGCLAVQVGHMDCGAVARQQHWRWPRVRYPSRRR